MLHSWEDQQINCEGVPKAPLCARCLIGEVCLLFTQTASGSSQASQSASASAAELVRGKEQWLYFVHPEQPEAGQRATIYFNNNVSDILR